MFEVRLREEVEERKQKEGKSLTTYESAYPEI